MYIFRSDVYITGIRKEIVNGNERYVILSNTEMKNIVDRERYDRKSDFDLLYIKEVEVTIYFILLALARIHMIFMNLFKCILRGFYKHCNYSKLDLQYIFFA